MPTDQVARYVVVFLVSFLVSAVVAFVLGSRLRRVFRQTNAVLGVVHDERDGPNG